MKIKLLISFGALALASVSFAGSTSVYSEGAFNADDFINWGQFGADFTTVNSGSHGFTNNGVGFTLYSANDFSGADDGGSYLTATEGSSWNGVFNSGDSVLYKASSFPSDLTIVFDTAIGGFGTGFQSNTFGDFVGGLGTWDGLYPAANPVGFANTSGSNFGGSTGTYPWMGVVSDQQDIFEIFVGVQMADLVSDPQGAGFGHTLIRDRAVPEPASMAALGLGVVALIRRRKQAK